MPFNSTTDPRRSGLPTTFLIAWIVSLNVCVANAYSQTREQGSTSGNIAEAYLAHLQQVASSSATRHFRSFTRTQLEGAIRADVEQSARSLPEAFFRNRFDFERFVEKRTKERIAKVNRQKQFTASSRLETLSYLDIKEASDYVTLAMPVLGYAPDRRIVVGDLNTRCINAMAIAVPGTADRVIAVKSGLVATLLTLANLFALTTIDDLNLALPRTSGMVPLRQMREHATQLALTQAYIQYFSGSRIESPVLTTNQKVVRDALFRGMLLFVMGHEYAHVLLGHTDTETKERTVLLETGRDAQGEVTVSGAQRSREQEHEADELGLNLALNAAYRQYRNSPRTNANFLALSLAGQSAEVLLAWMDIMEQAGARIAPATGRDLSLRDHASSTHRHNRLNRYRRDVLKAPQESVDELYALWNSTLRDIDRSPEAGELRVSLAGLNLSECD